MSENLVMSSIQKPSFSKKQKHDTKNSLTKQKNHKKSNKKCWKSKNIKK
jgi:hypothetical protein